MSIINRRESPPLADSASIPAELLAPQLEEYTGKLTLAYEKWLLLVYRFQVIAITAASVPLLLMAVYEVVFLGTGSAGVRSWVITVWIGVVLAVLAFGFYLASLRQREWSSRRLLTLAIHLERLIRMASQAREHSPLTGSEQLILDGKLTEAEAIYGIVLRRFVEPNYGNR